jgi:hypothetical protein
MQSGPAALLAVSETHGELKRADYQIGLPDLGSFSPLLSEVRREKRVLTGAERAKGKA